MKYLTIEDKKRLAEWMGWSIVKHSPFDEYFISGKNGIEVQLRSFTPEKGGEDLTKVLSKLTMEWFFVVLIKLPVEFSCGFLKNFEELKDVIFYMNDIKNAPVIVEAILNLIKELDYDSNN